MSVRNKLKFTQLGNGDRQLLFHFYRNLHKDIILVVTEIDL